MKTNLNLQKCPESVLDNLPENMEVRGSLNLYKCQSLQSLPKNLKVGGYLDLNNCYSLTSLPKGLKVGGDLYLGDCESLTSLPKGLKVGEEIWINPIHHDYGGTGVKKEDFPKRLWKKIKEE